MTSGEKMFWGGFTVLVLVLICGGIAYKAAHPTAVTSSSFDSKTIADPSGLPGLLVGSTPWNANTAQLHDRLAAIGFPNQMSMEGQVLHIHQHLNIFVNGTQITVPANVGIGTGFISPIHTHDTSGIIHVESPIQATFTLGQFFDVWGIRFTKDCIGGYCATQGKTLRVYADGKLYEGDPRQMELKQHAVIAVIYGTLQQTPSPLPTTYTFPSGY